jgi:signal peptidase II
MTVPVFHHRKLGFGFAGVIIVLDQLAKWIVLDVFSLDAVRQVRLLSIFNLTYVENRGISFGLFEAGSETGRWLLVALTLAVSGGVGWWLWHERNRGDVWALALILGGALGNIIDRIRFGYVVDYADLHFGGFQPFLVFNIADACITIGVLLLVARSLLVREKAATGEAA